MLQLFNILCCSESKLRIYEVKTNCAWCRVMEIQGHLFPNFNYQLRGKLHDGHQCNCSMWWTSVQLFNTYDPFLKLLVTAKTGKILLDAREFLYNIKDDIVDQRYHRQFSAKGCELINQYAELTSHKSYDWWCNHHYKTFKTFLMKLKFFSFVVQ